VRERDLAHAQRERERRARSLTRGERGELATRGERGVLSLGVCARVYSRVLTGLGPQFRSWGSPCSGSQAADKSARPIVVINLPRRLALGCPRPAAVHVMVIVPVLTRGPLGASCVGGNGGGGNGGGCHADSALLSLGDVYHSALLSLGDVSHPRTSCTTLIQQLMSRSLLHTSPHECWCSIACVPAAGRNW